MKLSNSKVILSALLVFSVLIGLSCVSAENASADNGPIVDDNNDFSMSVPYNTGTGYHWEISPETHGVELVSSNNVIDHPGMSGSSATAIFNFHVNSDDYYVKLVLLSPTGNVVDSVDSDMLN